MAPPGEIPPWVAAAIRQAAQISEAIDSDAGRRQRRVAQQIAEAARRHATLIKPGLESAMAAHRAWRQGLPSNWHGLDPDELTATLKLVEDSGLCVVWAPREEIVRQILGQEGTQEQLLLLAARKDDILDDLTAVLKEAAGAGIVSGHGDACEFAGDGIDAARAGLFRPAQAAAAAGLGLVLHASLGFPQLRGLGEAFKRFNERDLDETVLRLLKLSLIELCTAKALLNTKKAVPGFNRHGTQHGDPAFFSPANTLCGLLLLVAWLRELKWFAEHHPEVFAGD